jgi:hypothetical protein
MASQASGSAVSWTSNEMLAERRLRSSELALATTRKRLFEADEEIGRLYMQIRELEGELAEARSAARREPERLQAELRVSEQTLWDERQRRVQLEREIELTRAPWSATAERELSAAQRRVRELEGELELVRRHAAEFEQAIRVSVDDAWRWLRAVGDRLQLALREQHAREQRATKETRSRWPRADVASSLPWVLSGSSTSSPTLSLTAPPPPAPRAQAPPAPAPRAPAPPPAPPADDVPAEHVRADRLDEARSRLQEAVPEEQRDVDAAADQAPPAEHPAAREPALRRLFRRLFRRSS